MSLPKAIFTTAAAGVLLCMALISHAAEPPVGLPIGWDEWSEGGKKPLAEYSFDSSQNGLEIAMMTYDGAFPKLGHVANSHTDKAARILHIYHGSSDPANALYAPAGFTFELRNSEIFPLFGELYVVSLWGPHSIDIKRVTDDIPKEFHPRVDSKIISRASRNECLFAERFKGPPEKETWENVELMNVSGDVAELHFSPRYSSRVNLGPAVGKAYTSKIRKGESVSGRGRSYKVLNVVPVKTIRGIGNLAGWVELDPTSD